jgi:hypothetical protein
MSVGNKIELGMVPNSVATRSVITPDAYQALRAANLIGLDVFDIHFFGDFGSIEINTRTLRVKLRLDPRASRR